VLVVPAETLITQALMVVIHLLLPLLLLMLLPLEVVAAVGAKTAVLLLLMAVMVDLEVAVVVLLQTLLVVLEPMVKEMTAVLGRLQTAEAAEEVPVLLVIMATGLLVEQVMVEMELHLLLPVLL
jgi:hypothetical protein